MYNYIYSIDPFLASRLCRRFHHSTGRVKWFRPFSSRFSPTDYKQQRPRSLGKLPALFYMCGDRTNIHVFCIYQFFCSQLFYNCASASSHLCNHSIWTWFFFSVYIKLWFWTHKCSWTFNGGHHDYGINYCISSTTGCLWVSYQHTCLRLAVEGRILQGSVHSGSYAAEH